MALVEGTSFAAPYLGSQAIELMATGKISVDEALAVLAASAAGR